MSSNETFKIYPNPADGEIFLSKPGSYTVYDMLGRIFLNEKNTASLNISTLKTGTYIVKNSEGFTQKSIVNWFFLL